MFCVTSGSSPSEPHMEENFFKSRRDELRKTQRQIAEALEPPLTSAAVSAWETNVAAPSMDLVDQLARVYRVSTARVIEGIRAIWKAREAAQPKKKLVVAK